MTLGRKLCADETTISLVMQSVPAADRDACEDLKNIIPSPF